jgi:hypothetical protein
MTCFLKRKEVLIISFNKDVFCVLVLYPKRTLKGGPFKKLLIVSVCEFFIIRDKRHQMTKINKVLAPYIKICFDTVNAKIVYYILGILRNKNIRFITVDKDNLKDADIIVSDRRRGGETVLEAQEITYDPIDDFKKIALKLFGGRKEKLCIGVDPGKRTGIAVFYGKKLILNEVVSPWEDAILYVVEILKEIGFDSKVVKIGQGNPQAAEELRKVLQYRFSNLEVYFINEQRTTKTAKSKANQGKEKDKISAVAIVHKNGKRVV